MLVKYSLKSSHFISSGTEQCFTVADPVFWKGGAPRGNREKVVFGGQCRYAEGATMCGPKGGPGACPPGKFSQFQCKMVHSGGILMHILHSNETS